MIPYIYFWPWCTVCWKGPNDSLDSSVWRHQQETASREFEARLALPCLWPLPLLLWLALSSDGITWLSFGVSPLYYHLPHSHRWPWTFFPIHMRAKWILLHKSCWRQPNSLSDKSSLIWDGYCYKGGAFYLEKKLKWTLVEWYPHHTHVKWGRRLMATCTNEEGGNAKARYREMAGWSCRQTGMSQTSDGSGCPPGKASRASNPCETISAGAALRLYELNSCICAKVHHHLVSLFHSTFFSNTLLPHTMLNTCCARAHSSL